MSEKLAANSNYIHKIIEMLGKLMEQKSAKPVIYLKNEKLYVCLKYILFIINETMKMASILKLAKILFK